jgi:UMF1 family MFS transporter
VSEDEKVNLGIVLKDNPKTIRAWCMYDWANSVYSLNITSSIFPAYYQAMTKDPATGDKVSFFGLEVTNSVLYTYAISFAFLCIVLSSPLLGGIADHFGRKKFFMKLFCSLGSLACMGLFFFTGKNVEWGIGMLVLATIGYAGSLVFYNAYLPIITSHSMTDKVSAKGFSYGYVGSVILLVINIAMMTMPTWFGIPEENKALVPRISFLMVGIWWFAFAQYSFSGLPMDERKTNGSEDHFITAGFKELQKVWAQIQGMTTLKLFLFSFFLYSMGVQTVMYVATLFGEKEFHLAQEQLISVVLILQLVAILGANASARLSKKIGNLGALIVIVFFWIGICIAAYFMENGDHFYMVAAVVGLVMGGIQALSRSTYSKYIPQDTEDHASYFSFYDITEKTAIVIGTFSYGLIEQLTGTMRNSVLALGAYFILGLCFLFMARSSVKYQVSGIK